MHKVLSLCGWGVDWTTFLEFFFFFFFFFFLKLQSSCEIEGVKFNVSGGVRSSIGGMASLASILPPLCCFGFH